MARFGRCISFFNSLLGLVACAKLPLPDPSIFRMFDCRNQLESNLSKYRSGRIFLGQCVSREHYAWPGAKSDAHERRRHLCGDAQPFVTSIAADGSAGTSRAGSPS